MFPGSVAQEGAPDLPPLRGRAVLSAGQQTETPPGGNGTFYSTYSTSPSLPPAALRRTASSSASNEVTCSEGIP